MNKFIQAIKNVDFTAIEEMLQDGMKWIHWCEDSGKNGLHYLCGVDVSNNPSKAGKSLEILKLFLKKGMDINAVHTIPDDCGNFPATPLWYAYTRGRNEKLFTYLLLKGANPGNCMFAIAWNNDAESAALFKKYGAETDEENNGSTPFLAAFLWKKFKAAEWFLKNGANVNFADAKGNTALYYAVKRKDKIEQIQHLINSGADFNLENKEGVSPKKLAETNKQRKMLSLFTIQ